MKSTYRNGKSCKNKGIETFFIYLKSLITYKQITLTEDGVSKTQLNIQQFDHLKDPKSSKNNPMDQLITGCVIAFSPLLWIIFKSHDCIHYPLHMCATLLYLYSDNVGCTFNVTDELFRHNN